MLKFQGVLRRGAILLVFLVAACTGAGGPGAALDGGGPGGPVGGNFAAGPVSLPSTASPPTHPVEWASISCVNIEGPDFACDGREKSVPPQAVLEFKIFPPAAAQPRDSFSTTASATGVWSVTRPGVPGERVEICVLQNGLCRDMSFVIIPAENVGVQPSPGTTKNLVIDPQGKSWHSRLLPRGGILSWFVGEAHAETEVTTEAVECRGLTPEIPTPREGGPTCHLFSRTEAQGEKTELNFDDCQQTDIGSIVQAKDPAGREPLLLVAVKHSLYVVKTTPTTQILRRYVFPGNVTGVVSMGSHFAVFVAAAERPLFFLDLRAGALETAGCYELDEDLRGLTQVTSFQALKNHFAISGFFQNEGVSEYRVIVGAFSPGSTQFQQLPVTLHRSPNPMEVRILQANDSSVAIALLKLAEKKLLLIQHPYVRAGYYFVYLLGGGTGDQVSETNLESLNVLGENYSVQRPQLLDVDYNSNYLGFVDFAERTSNLVTLRYGNPSGVLQAPTTAVVTDLGRSTVPVDLRVDMTRNDGTWIYSLSHGAYYPVQPEQELYQILGPYDGE